MMKKEKKNMDTTKFKVEDIFGDVISQDSLSPEKINKLSKFVATLL